MITLEEVCEKQLEHAVDKIAQGRNWEPELIMFVKGKGVVIGIPSSDPVTPAIELVNRAKPDFYSFCSEAWMAFMEPGVKKEDYRRGDATRAEHRMEVLTQTYADHSKQKTRLFSIDRVNKKLNPISALLPGFDSDDVISRMPKDW